MGILKSLLGAETFSGLDKSTSELNKITTELIVAIQDIMKVVMPIVLAIVLALGVFFCIKLGIAYAKAEKTEDREEAKKRLVGAIIGFGIGVVGAAVMWILFTNYKILSALFGG